MKLSDLPPQFAGAVADAIKKVITEAIDEEIEGVQTRVADRVRGEIGLIAARCVERLSFETYGKELIIKCEFDFKK